MKEWEQVQELVSTAATWAGTVRASALRVPAVHMAFFNTVTRLDGSVLTTPPPLFAFLSSISFQPGEHILSLSPLEELGCLNSICCFPSLPFSPDVR